MIRAYEVETVTAAGQHRYVVAIDGLLTAHGLAEHGDLAGPDAGLPGQERHGRGDVPVTPPAEVHCLAAGAAVAAVSVSSAP